MDYREARQGEIPFLQEFIQEHGVNQWNYLPAEGLSEEFALIISGDALALCVFAGVQLAGFALLIRGEACPEALAEYDDLARICFVAEVVVSDDHAGNGLGAELLRRCVAEARAGGFSSLYAWRHEENLASAGMMRKAGFEFVTSYCDPEQRSTGSQRTTVERFSI
ncbi:GNAT family N-acetyltransferase [Desulfotalea psychrophila]|uniref:N-acetyltransferase domain-containing protein n=1 Tax=Desulfotalea psychrophila (strain LSv54 / DSM 12343) TaxID=177439 RepID=Q6AIY3_DESPS|nr:GNAT family N-acetyltransferase [Desulfotalea psychrophila]CAG37697.1 conserved hypothetical protein [Desulfotalea psychrophila LSv54]